MAVSGVSFTSLVNSMVTAAQAASTALLDVSVGSIALAIFQACAGVALWLQGLVLQLLAVTRASTSAGNDLDSFVADFGVARLPAISATGTVTFSRFASTQDATVLPGTIVSAGVGGAQFSITLDTTNAFYDTVSGSYILPSGTTSMDVLATAVIAGVAGNAIASSINSILSPIPGIDTVTNAAPFSGGFDPESDAALRVRFVLYIQSLSKATKFAIGYAILSIRQGLIYLLAENQNLDGSSHPGFFYVVVDDGSGMPPASLITEAQIAIEAVRACGVTYAVYSPTIVSANITMATTSLAGANHINDAAAVKAALIAAIDVLPLGATLPYTQLSQIAYNASPTIINVTSVTLNGGTSDLSVASNQVVKTATVSVS